MIFEPYKTYSLTDSLKLHVFGKPNNWGMHSAESWINLRMLAEEMNITKIVSPFPEEFNTRICRPEELIQYTPDARPSSVKIFRTPRGKPGEGAVIMPGTSFWTTSADCPMILIYDEETKQAAASHSGRDSLITYDNNQSKIRPNDSVIEGIIKTFPESRHAYLKVFFVCRIEPEHFANPINDKKHGERNKKIIDTVVTKWGTECIIGDLNEGHISLPILIRKQCEYYGIPKDHITDGGLDTFSDPHLWSHRDGNKERNGIFVVHRNSIAS
jgi:hypothetical protein